MTGLSAINLLLICHKSVIQVSQSQLGAPFWALLPSITIIFFFIIFTIITFIIIITIFIIILITIVVLIIFFLKFIFIIIIIIQHNDYVTSRSGQ